MVPPCEEIKFRGASRLRLNHDLTPSTRRLLGCDGSLKPDSLVDFHTQTTTTELPSISARPKATSLRSNISSLGERTSTPSTGGAARL